MTPGASTLRVSAALTALAATACAPLPTPPTPPLPPPTLVGEWRVVAVNGRPTIGTAKIAPPRFSIDFGCNWGRGHYRLETGALVPAGPLGTTERGCVTPAGEPDESMLREDEGFRVAARPMRINWYGADYARLSNEAGSIDLAR